jgi:hypothetical protein
MAVSPDLAAYIDLTVFDRDPTAIAARAIADAQAKLPSWIPRAGNTEVVLIETLSQVVAELVFAVNRLPTALLEAELALLGATRDPGNPPTATATFTFVDATGYTIPAGIRLNLTTPSGSMPFTTDHAVIAPPGATTLTVGITGGVNTDAANGTVTGTPVELLDSLFMVNQVVLGSSVAGGRSIESDTDWLTRGVNILSGLTSTYVLARHFTLAALAMTDDNVYRAFTLDEWDAGSGGTAVGHVTVAVLAPGGAFLTATQKADVQARLAAGAQAGLAIHVIDPTVTPVAVTATVHTNSDPATVRAACVVALEQFLSTDTWQWGSEVRVNSLIAVLSQTPGVTYVSSIATPGSDIALPGAAPLAKLGAVAITAVNP